MADQNFLNAQELVVIEAEHLKELGDYALGLKLLIKCSQATYVGVCHHVLHDCREIILEQVSVVNSGESRFGLVIIFYHDIIKLNIIGVEKEARKRLWKELYGDQKHRTVLMKQILPPSLCDGVEEELQVCGDATTTLLPNSICHLIRPTEWKIIDTFEENYETALLNIKQENVVSIFGCGLKLGRRGTLAWLCLEVGCNVYLFDVAKLGADVFIKSEVGAIFNDETKVKILHNGRKLEDYFHHHHNVSMVNVFDTQASDIYLESLREANKTQLLVKSLPTLLQQHLPTVSTSKLFPETQEVEESLWLERPLPEAIVPFLIHSVIFLRELRETMLKRMLVNLDHINKIFLASLRDKPSAFVDYVRITKRGQLLAQSLIRRFLLWEVGYFFSTALLTLQREYIRSMD